MNDVICFVVLNKLDDSLRVTAEIFIMVEIKFNKIIWFKFQQIYVVQIFNSSNRPKNSKNEVSLRGKKESLV